MTLTLVLLCVAAAALIAFATSAVCALGSLVARRWIESRTPAAQARLYLVLAALPVTVTAAVMVAALAPSFGWIADHCSTSGEAHVHPHICSHHQSVFPALPIVGLASLLAIRGVLALLRAGALAWSVARTRHSLLRQAQPHEDGILVLPMAQPLAFILGGLSPRIYVTRGLLETESRAHLAAALAHERAHLRRGDPWTRLLARLVLVFHLPVVAPLLERRLARAQEMAADEEAATEIGSRRGVAETLVHLARVGVRLPRAALAFGSGDVSDVELRVRALLQTPSRVDGPRPRSITALGMLGGVGIGLGADAVHHGVEILLGLLGG